MKPAFTLAFGTKVEFSRQLTRQETSYWDSLTHVVFLVHLEKEFGVKFDVHSANTLTRIPDIAQRIQQLLGAAHAV